MMWTATAAGLAACRGLACCLLPLPLAPAAAAALWSGMPGRQTMPPCCCAAWSWAVCYCKPPLVAAAPLTHTCTHATSTLCVVQTRRCRAVQSAIVYGKTVTHRKSALESCPPRVPALTGKRAACRHLVLRPRVSGYYRASFQAGSTVLTQCTGIAALVRWNTLGGGSSHPEHLPT
jgi:hypothetical protein